MENMLHSTNCRSHTTAYRTHCVCLSIHSPLCTLQSLFQVGKRDPVHKPVRLQNQLGWGHWASGWSARCSAGRHGQPGPGGSERCICAASVQTHSHTSPANTVKSGQTKKVNISLLRLKDAQFKVHTKVKVPHKGLGTGLLQDELCF